MLGRQQRLKAAPALGIDRSALTDALIACFAVKVLANRQPKVADEVVLFALNQQVSATFANDKDFRSKRMPAAWLSVLPSGQRCSPSTPLRSVCL